MKKAEKSGMTQNDSESQSSVGVRRLARCGIVCCAYRAYFSIDRFCQQLSTSNGIEHFLPVNGHLFRCLDPEADLVATDLHHNDLDVVVDDDALVFFPRQDQH